MGKVPRKDISVSPSPSSDEEEEERRSAPSSRTSSPAREENLVIFNLKGAALTVEEVPPMVDEDLEETQTQNRTSEEEEEDTQQTEDESQRTEDELGDVPRAASKRKRRASQVILPDEVERQLGEWLEHEVPYFYNKGMADYKNKAKQKAVMEEKGKTFDPPLTVQ